MKKRAMKKYIPYGDYCYGKIEGILPGKKGYRTTGMCKNLVKHKLIDDFISVPKAMGSKEYVKMPTKYWVRKCRYTNTRTDEDACLYDSCKICGVREREIE